MNKFFLLFFSLLLCNIHSSSQDTTQSNYTHYNILIKESNQKESNSTKKIISENCKNLCSNTDFHILIGATQFFGDIKQYDHLPAYEKSINFWEIKSALELSFRKKINQLFSLQTSVIIGKFGGLKREKEGSNYEVDEQYPGYYEGNGEYFVTDFTEFDAQLLLNLSNTLHLYNSSPNNYTIYLKGGIGLNFFNSINKNIESGNLIYAYGYRDELFPSEYVKKDFWDQPRETVYIYGFITEYEINDKLSLLMDITKRKANTDFWDSHDNKSKQDNFNFYSVGVSYNIWGKTEKEEWMSPLEGLQEDINSHQANIEWLSEDKDNDGVSDAFDKEPNTPMGVSVDGSGSSLDVDMDNVPDYLDSDPFSSRGAIVDVNGVEFDTDNDGIPDSKDLESNTEIGSIVNQYGISVSSSGIGTNSESYLPSVYFELGSYYINNSNLKRLATIAIVMKNNPNIKLNVIGNADKIGTSAHNKKLALNRANEVINFLSRNFDIDKNRFTAISNGEEKPLSKDEVSSEFLNINTLSINRRVDFQIIR